jgi:hypothetical protein
MSLLPYLSPSWIILPQFLVCDDRRPLSRYGLAFNSRAKVGDVTKILIHSGAGNNIPWVAVKNGDVTIFLSDFVGKYLVLLIWNFLEFSKLVTVTQKLVKIVSKVMGQRAFRIGNRFQFCQPHVGAYSAIPRALLPPVP